jgi:hypothetical protein
MQQSEAWESLGQAVCLRAPERWQRDSGRRTAQTSAVDVSVAVTVPVCLRSRTRTRRCRRKRAWGARWAYLRSIFVVCHTLRMGYFSGRCAV